MTLPEYSDEWVIGPDNTKFFVRLQAPKAQKGAVLLVHGFVEHIKRYDFVREALVTAGFAVLAYDQRGFGETALNEQNRSPDSSFGKNSRTQLLADIQFFLHLTKERFKTENLFIYGHSMGGALALSYPCIGPKDLNVNRYVLGVVATSPLIRQAIPAAQWKLTAGHVVSKLRPWQVIPASISFKDLSHDAAINKKYEEDPLVQQFATLRGVDTMLRGGVDLAENHYRQWPESLPVYIVHGTADKITSYAASQKFYEEVKATDKTLVPMQDGFHELHNEPHLKVDLEAGIVKWLEDHLPKSSTESGHKQVDTNSHAPVATKSEVGEQENPNVTASKL